MVDSADNKNESTKKKCGHACTKGGCEGTCQLHKEHTGACRCENGHWSYTY